MDDLAHAATGEMSEAQSVVRWIFEPGRSGRFLLWPAMDQNGGPLFFSHPDGCHP